MRKENTDDIDKTVLVDEDIPASWKCPRCGKVRQTGIYASRILIEHGTYVGQCGNCGYLHCWELRLSDKYKKKVIDFLVNGEW